ncbi:hypothetical protein IID62_03765 [candidate division KSB1 bacterium]|nr:hypothetical protein [candidate division KSB1 bacterium]
MRYLIIIEEIKQLIDSDVKNNNYVTNFVDNYGIRKRILSDLFRLEYGYGIKEYIGTVRIECLRKMIKNSDNNVSIVSFTFAVELGYKDSSGLHKLLDRKLKLSLEEFVELVNSEKG